MKKMACKICGSTDITMDGDTVSCESCGNKYTLPSSKASNKVHKVKADKSGEAENFLKRAQTFYEEGELEKVIDYCNKALDIDADNLKALFLLAFSSIANNYDNTITSLKKIKKSASEKDFLSYIEECVEGALSWFNGADNLNYIVLRLNALLRLQYEFKKNFSCKIPNGKDIIKKANELLQQNYDVSDYIYINKYGRYECVDFVVSLKEVIHLLGKNKELDVQTQQVIAEEMAVFSKEFLPEAYNFFINGLFHDMTTPSYPKKKDIEIFIDIHITISGLMDDVIQYCQECKDENKISLCETMAEHFDLYAECETQEGDDRIGFNSEAKQQYQDQAEKYRQKASEIARNGDIECNIEEDELMPTTEETSTEDVNPTEKDERIFLGIWCVLIAILCVLLFIDLNEKHNFFQRKRNDPTMEIIDAIENNESDKNEYIKTDFNAEGSGKEAFLGEKFVENFIKYENSQLKVEHEKRQNTVEESREEISTEKKLLADIIADKTSHVLGNPDGSFVIIEFFDYRCAYSQFMNKKIARAIKKSDNIRWILVDTPIFGEKSEIIANYAFAAARQNKLEKFHLAISNSNVSEEELIKIAKNLKLNIAQLKEDAYSNSAKEKLRKNMEYAKRIGLKGTPTFIIDGEKVEGAFTDEVMEEYIRQAENRE